jgi:nucleoside-diphosphate-sugar epimerase
MWGEVVSNPSDISESRFFVTGGAGFIGSALVEELLKAGAEVLVYDSFIYGHESNVRGLEGKLNVVMGDILSWRMVECLTAYKPDYVIHLAAEPFIPYSYENPERFLDVNINGTLNILKASRLAKAKRIIFFSSSEVYGTGKILPINEDHPTLPLSAYAVSKLAADRLCFVFAREQGIPVIIVRPFNCYGPRETQPYVIPEIISQLVRGKQVRLGNLKARRDFTYVYDTTKCVLQLATADIENGEVVNIGSNRSYSIEEIARLVGELVWHEDIEIVVERSRMRPLDLEVLQCDYSKVHRISGWKPTTSIEDGMKKTIDWYIENGKSWTWERIALPRREYTL